MASKTEPPNNPPEKPTEQPRIEYVDKLAMFENWIKFKATPHLDKLLVLPHKIIFLDSGNQGGKCVTYQTLIETPNGELSIGELYERGEDFDVWAWDGEKRVVAKAHAPFRKPHKEPCVRITMSDGRWCEPALGHRILMQNGYSSIQDALCTYFQIPVGTNSEPYPSTQVLGDLNFYRKPSSYLDDYYVDLRQYDEQPRMDQDNAPVFVPSLTYDMLCSGLSCNADDRDNKCKDILRSIFCHLSSQGVTPLSLDLSSVFSDSMICITSQLSSEGQITLRQLSFAEFYDLLSDTASHQYQYHNQSFSCHKSPFLEVCGNQAISFSFIPCQYVFDFEVEKYHNYFSAGLIHHNTSCVAYALVTAILGIHPVPHWNELSNSIRCLSSSLPESSDPQEQDNTQYLELKKLIPYEMILKDISTRSQTLTVAGHQGKHYIEFKSTKQELQDTGKVQRGVIWMDEESPRAYREESRMRLHARDGLEIITLTPINGISYLYDDVFLRAGYIWRSPTICKKFNLPMEEFKPTGSKDIAVLQMATDDNPTLNPESIDRIFDAIEDPDELAVRRYGIFKQISGRVHKNYSPLIHYISFNKYFPNGIPYDWTHARGIDYHESRIPWSVGWLSASPEDEWFLWQEFHPAIDGVHAMNTYDIAKHIIRHSSDYYYTVNLIDPLANKKQANTLLSVTDDLNRYFDEFRKEHGMGTSTLWQGWDTKDTKGRDEIKRRFKNATECGVPFNNIKREKGGTRRLPTLWICDTCPEFNKSIQRWSFGEWATVRTRQINDPLVKPQSKYSHDCMTLECLAKDIRLKKWDRPSYLNKRDTSKFSVTGKSI